MFDDFLDLFGLDTDPNDEFQNDSFGSGDTSVSGFQNESFFPDGFQPEDNFQNESFFPDGFQPEDNFQNESFFPDGVQPTDNFQNDSFFPDVVDVDDDFQNESFYNTPYGEHNLVPQIDPSSLVPDGMDLDMDEDLAPDVNMENPFMMENHVKVTDLLGLDLIQYDQVLDRDGDGEADVWIQEQQIDFNGDGIPEIVWAKNSLDEDGDGQEDADDIVFALNLDGDETIDFMQVGHDYEGDGILDAVEEVIVDGENVELEPEPEDFEVVDGGVPTYVPYDPDNADPDCVVGDPEEAMDSWHWQETDSSCAVASQEFILEILTGQEFEESDLRDLAEEQGWYTPEGGTLIADVGNILEHMGLNVERTGGNSIEDLEECLENGGEVIVAVDSDELWYGDSDDAFGPGMDPDHAIQVIGVDRSDPDQPMVILNDPGTANGGGAMVPLELFMEAWEDSDCFMMEAYA